MMIDLIGVMRNRETSEIYALIANVNLKRRTDEWTCVRVLS